MSLNHIFAYSSEKWFRCIIWSPVNACLNQSVLFEGVGEGKSIWSNNDHCYINLDKVEEFLIQTSVICNKVYCIRHVNKICTLDVFRVDLGKSMRYGKLLIVRATFLRSGHVSSFNVREQGKWERKAPNNMQALEPSRCCNHYTSTHSYLHIHF
ncbi:hypothetical protein BDF20DRAFT_839463 [Mycotypha africana]|uniref:uncharacterized protein n=1 Tax=Mycotypha africana TaxID=64632 RepID=UPI002301D045|nr:uncharacterized protein BDF20DRAFT_839463 [Mycotypha africana]KAI8968348.1 hypothetical protein BDF20DRAFT_839463 [Mycotypha africana]